MVQTWFLIPPNSRENLHLKKSSDKDPHCLCSIQTARNRWGLNRQLVWKTCIIRLLHTRWCHPMISWFFKAPVTSLYPPTTIVFQEVNPFSLIWKTSPHETLGLVPDFHIPLGPYSEVHNIRMGFFKPTSPRFGGNQVQGSNDALLSSLLSWPAALRSFAMRSASPVAG